MSINSINSSALLGIQKGLDSLARDAHNIASGGAMESVSSSKVLRSLVNLSQNELQVAASATVLRHADEAIGTLLDIKV